MRRTLERRIFCAEKVFRKNHENVNKLSKLGQQNFLVKDIYLRSSMGHNRFELMNGHGGVIYM